MRFAISAVRLLAIGLAAAFVLYLIRWWWTPTGPIVVVYCAHDSIFAEDLFQRFQEQSGIRVLVRYDTEASKSLGLVNRILLERDTPQCDVFWNNELLGTLDLQDAGLLAPYQGEGYRRIPEAFRDPQGHWTGFAARLRVWIVNKQSIEATPEAVAMAQQKELTRMAIAKPLYGTTRFHYTVLWDQWGGERLKKWHADQRSRGIREEAGNAMVKNVVAAGKCDLGWTDTDDYFVALDDGAPVEMLPVRLEDRRTLCIPNTVAILKGARHPEEARRLVDFLLSQESEYALACSRSRQIPLGTMGDRTLPADVESLLSLASEGTSLSISAASRADCLRWLKEEYVP
jgi:iron(III) transport system substrate-binding protein